MFARYKWQSCWMAVRIMMGPQRNASYYHHFSEVFPDVMVWAWHCYVARKFWEFRHGQLVNQTEVK